MSNNEVKAVRRLGIDDGEEKTIGIVIPCPPEHFAEFLSGLLGEKNQVIQDRFDGGFEIKKSDIESMHHLILQRVNRQHSAQLVRFTLLIAYDDNSTVILNSFQEFLTYAEVKPRISTGFQMSFTFLIRFEGRDVPEKQTIDIGFDTLEKNIGTTEAGVASSGVLLPGFSLRIYHTERTWGVDIESLVAGHIATLRNTNNSKFRKTLSSYAAESGAAVTIVSFVISFKSLIGLADQYKDTKASMFRNFVATVPEKERVAESINHLMTDILYGSFIDYQTYLQFAMIGVSIVSVIFGSVVARLMHYKPYGALLLTNKSEIDYARKLIKDKVAWLPLIITIMLSISTSIIGNYIYAYLVAK